jgi:rRNA processing protein Gar1
VNANKGTVNGVFGPMDANKGTVNGVFGPVNANKGTVDGVFGPVNGRYFGWKRNAPSMRMTSPLR